MTGTPSCVKEILAIPTAHSGHYKTPSHTHLALFYPFKHFISLTPVVSLAFIMSALTLTLKKKNLKWLSKVCHYFASC